MPDLESLVIDLADVGAEAVGKLKLTRPLKVLVLARLTDTNVARLDHLPQSAHLMVVQYSLTVPGYTRLAQLAAGIEQLNFNGGAPKDIDDEGLKAIGQIGSLKRLTLFTRPVIARGQTAVTTTWPITDAGLAHLEGLDKLEELKLFSCQGIRGPGYAALAPIKSLRHLTVSNAPIDAAGFAALAKLTQLDGLVLQPDDFPPASFKPADVGALKSLSHLEMLAIGTTSAKNSGDLLAYGDAILATAAEMPRLRQLTIRGIGTAADGLEAFAKAAHLQELHLDQVVLNDRALAAIGEMKELRKLELGGKGIVSDAVLAKLAGLPQITELSFSGSGMTDDALRQLANLRDLEILRLPDSKITGTGLAAFDNLKHLKDITLANSPFDDDGAEALRGLPTIEWLNLAKTKITDRALDAIAALPNLHMVTLDGTSVTADGLMKLRDLKHLSRISVVGIKASAGRMARLRGAMPDVQISNGLEDYELQPETESEMRRRYEENPAAIVPYAAFLGRHGKLEEAFALLEKARGEDQPLPPLCFAAVETLRTNLVKATDAQKKLVEQWLAAAIQEAPNAVQLQLLSVNLYDMEGRFADSISTYRGLLARSDVGRQQRAVIQNNLAYLLVTHGSEKDLAEARSLIDAAVAQLGPVAAVLDTRGLIHLAQGDAQAAVSDFKVVVDDAPTSVNYFHLALAQDKASDAAGAAEAFHKAEELNLDTKKLSPDRAAGLPASERSSDQTRKELILAATAKVSSADTANRALLHAAVVSRSDWKSPRWRTGCIFFSAILCVLRGEPTGIQPKAARSP